MRKLLYCELKRTVRDKLFLVTCLIGLGLAIFTPLLYKVIFSALEIDEALLGMAGIGISGKSLFFQAFLPGGDFGLVMPILLSIIICKDFSYGTVRNKIISGAKRSDIFFSIFFTNTIIMCSVMLSYALVTLGVSLIFFEFSSTTFVAADLLYLALSVLFEMLVYAFIASLVSLLCVFAKNVGLVIVMYFGINFFFTIVGSIASTAIMLMPNQEGVLFELVKILANSNVFTSTVIGSGTEYGLSDILCITLPTVLGGALLVFLGTIIFKKKDLK